MTFNEWTDTWFGGLADIGAQLRSNKQITNLLRKLPNRSNLTELRAAVSRLVHDELLRTSLLGHIDAILDRKFGDEYRFHFSPDHRAVSASSSFFSLFAQAIRYEVMT